MFDEEKISFSKLNVFKSNLKKLIYRSEGDKVKAGTEHLQENKKKH